MESQRQSPDAEAKAESSRQLTGAVEQLPGFESAAPAQTVHQSVFDGGRLPTKTQAMSLQRMAGNRATARLLRKAAASPRVQRHPEGAPLLGGLATAGGGSAKPLPMPTGEAVDGGTATTDGGTSGGSSPATDGGSTGGTTPSGPTSTPDGGATTTDAETTATTPAPTSTVTPPRLTMPTLQTAFAQEALQTAFGDIAPKTIITGNITIVADSAALYAKYDEWMIAHNMTNAAGNPWAAGDAKREDDAGGFRTNAFAEPAPSTNIFIDATQTDPTATVHEMLHVNTATDFIGKVGRAINEGITQRLAVQAISSTGHSVVGSENTYQQEQRVVTELIKVVGEPIVKQAYFNGAATLIDTYHRLMGADTFALLKSTLSTDNQAGYDAAVTMLVPPGVTQRIAAIKAVLDGWWVSADDFQIIASIVDAADGPERMRIYNDITPLVKTLWSEAKRSRLRQILMVGMPAVNDQPQGDTMIA